MLPAGHVRKVLRWASTRRLEGVTAGPPSPRIGQVVCQRSLYKLNDVLTNVR